MASSSLALESSNPITVYSVTFTNLTAGLASASMRTITGNVLIASIRVQANSSLVVDIPFLADRGLRVVGSGSSLRITVCHSSSG